MQKIKQSILFISALLLLHTSYGQMAAVKKFDYTILKDKILYIPTFAASEKFISRMGKKGKYDKISDAKAKAEHYNKIWKEAMAESSYDATDYEIKAYDRKQLLKSKDSKAILLYFYMDEYGNRQAMMMVTGPKRKVIARTIITGLDLSNKNDIRLMVNMLNESLNTASELNEEGTQASSKSVRNKYKEALVEWYADMKDKTFLVPKSEHKNAKKAANRNADLKTALKTWKLSNSDFTTEDEINNKRIEGDPDSFYWKSFPIYTKSPLITYNYNIILSTEGDDVIMAFMGKKRLKPATLEQIQRKIVTKAEKYKKQLAK